MDTAQENSNTSANASTTQTSSQTQISEQYKESSIYVRGNNEEGYYATLSDYMIIAPHKNETEIYYQLDNPSADLIATIAAIACTNMEKHIHNTYKHLLTPKTE